MVVKFSQPWFGPEASRLTPAARSRRRRGELPWSRVREAEAEGVV